MMLYPLLGSFSHNQAVMVGGFQLGASNSVLRDGTKVASAEKMFTVTKLGTGHYKVVFNDNVRPLPGLPFIFPTIEQAAPATTPCNVRYVKGTWSASTRSFELEVETVGTTPAASDGDAGDRVSFLIIGAYASAGVDPA